MGNQLGLRRSGMITRNTENGSIVKGHPPMYLELLSAVMPYANSNPYYQWVGKPQCIPQMPSWATTSDAVFDGYKQMTVAQAINGSRGWLMYCMAPGFGNIIHNRNTLAADLPRTWGWDSTPAQVKIDILPESLQQGGKAVFFTVAIFEPNENYWCTLATKTDAQGTVYAHAPGNNTDIGWNANIPHKYAGLETAIGGFASTWRHWFYFSRIPRNAVGAAWPPIDLATEPWYSFYKEPVYLCNARPNGYGQSLSVGPYDGMQLRLDNRDIPFLYVPDVNHTSVMYKKFKAFCENVALRQQGVYRAISDQDDIQVAKQMGVYGKRSAAEWDNCSADGSTTFCFETRNAEPTMVAFCAAHPDNPACGCTQSRLDQAFRAAFPSAAAEQYRGAIMANLACWDNPCSPSQAFLFRDKIAAVRGIACGKPPGCDMEVGEQERWRSYGECQQLALAAKLAEQQRIADQAAADLIRQQEEFNKKAAEDKKKADEDQRIADEKYQNYLDELERQRAEAKRIQDERNAFLAEQKRLLELSQAQADEDARALEEMIRKSNEAAAAKKEADQRAQQAQQAEQAERDRQAEQERLDASADSLADVIERAQREAANLAAQQAIVNKAITDAQQAADVVAETNAKHEQAKLMELQRQINLSLEQLTRDTASLNEEKKRQAQQAAQLAAQKNDAQRLAAQAAETQRLAELTAQQAAQDKQRLSEEKKAIEAQKLALIEDQRRIESVATLAEREAVQQTIAQERETRITSALNDYDRLDKLFDYLFESHNQYIDDIQLGRASVLGPRHQTQLAALNNMMDQMLSIKNDLLADGIKNQDIDNDVLALKMMIATHVALQDPVLQTKPNIVVQDEQTEQTQQTQTTSTATTTATDDTDEDLDTQTIIIIILAAIIVAGLAKYFWDKHKAASDGPIVRGGIELDDELNEQAHIAVNE